MEFETILFDQKSHTVLITLNRPERLNTYNEVMHRELLEAWTEINQNDEIWTVVMNGAGRAFCAGADVREAAEHMGKGEVGPPRWQYNVDFLRMFNEISHRRVMRTGITNPRLGYPGKPLISAIHGICCGDGLGWTYSSDFAICSEDATFFDPHVNVCIAPPGIHALARTIPRHQAFAIEFMGLGYRMDAQRAFEIGLVTEVVPREQLLERALGIAEEINEGSAPLAIRATKSNYWMTTNMNLQEARSMSRVLDNQVRFRTEDAKEGHRAIKENRRPEWKAR